MKPTELTAGDFATYSDPYELFGLWLTDAEGSEINDPNAMSLATVDQDGMPDIRVVLLKGFDRDGFVFYTNFESDKGRQLLGQPRAGLCFHWKSLRRQVRIRGTVEPVSSAEADEYYATRPRGSRIGAWASRQSRPLPDRATLEKAVADYEEKFEGEEPPRPDHWSGFRIKPVQMEFWHDRPFRLHDRVRFDSEGGDWRKGRLYP